MIEMQYQNIRMQPKIILDNRTYNGYEYFILNLHTHPCAYVCLTKDDIFYKKHYDDLYEEHFPITPNFSSDMLRRISDNKDGEYNIIKDWIIGWSYDNLNDFVAGIGSGHKYTTAEILEDVYDFIDVLKDKNLASK